MDRKVKKYLEGRPFAAQVAQIADGVDNTPMLPSARAHEMTTAMIAYAILDHADAVRELTAVLERGGDE